MAVNCPGAGVSSGKVEGRQECEQFGQDYPKIYIYSCSDCCCGAGDEQQRVDFSGQPGVKKEDKMAGLTRNQMDAVSQELKYINGTYEMSDKGYEILESASLVWAMLIAKDGRAVWSWRLPDEIPEYYTLADVSVLSKWYLKDYPVRTWKYGDGIMVYGCDKRQYHAD